MKSLGRGPRYVDNIGRLEAWFAWETKEDSQKSIDAYLNVIQQEDCEYSKICSSRVA